MRSMKFIITTTACSLGAFLAWSAVVDYGALDPYDTAPTVDGAIGAGEYDLEIDVVNIGFGGMFDYLYIDTDCDNLYFGIQYDGMVNNNAVAIYLDTDAGRNYSSVYAGAQDLSDVTDNNIFTEMAVGFEGSADGDQGNDPEWATGPDTYVFDADFAMTVIGYAGDISGSGTGDAGGGNQMGFFGLDVADLSDLDWLAFTYANSDGNQVAEFSIALSTLTGYAPAANSGFLSSAPGSSNEIYFSAVLLNADNAWLSNESAPQAHSTEGNGIIDIVNVGAFWWEQNGAIPEANTLALTLMSGFILCGLRRRRRM